jgi:hypothetical protein
MSVRGHRVLPALLLIFQVKFGGRWSIARSWHANLSSTIGKNAGVVCIFAWVESFSAVKIERRPRGASRINPLLHLLKRTTVCEAMVARLGCPPKNRVVQTRLTTMAYQA